MACSSSIIGVSSIYHKNPSLEQHLHRKLTTPTTPTHLHRPTDRTHFTSIKAASIPHRNAAGARGGSGFVSAATAAPNNILSEKAFEGFGVFDEDDSSLGGSDGEYDDGSEIEFEDGGVGGGDDNELAVGKLGLPQRLEQGLEKRGITKLFPIQVIS